MLINNFNNMDPELLAILLGWHKKCATNIIRCIQDKHLGCISLSSASMSFSMGRFSSMCNFLSCSSFLEESSRNYTLCLYMSGCDLTKGYGSPQRGPRKRLDSMGSSAELRLE